MSAFYDLASLVLVPSGYKASKVYAQKPLTTDGQLTFSRASTATRVNSAGLIETVGSNVPRLDYLGSTCPKLLLEPQRSNVCTYSSAFDNAAWVGGNVTVTADSVASPYGTVNADTFTEDAATAQHSKASPVISFVSGTTYTFSAFAKNAPSGRGFVQLYGYQLGSGAANVFANFDLNTGALGTATGGTSTITSYGNGWYRCTFTFTCGTTQVERMNLVNVTSASATAGQSYAGDITKSIYWWGAQVEVGAYATSYIPTTSAAVTRLADECRKGGISSLIGQTEGTLFVEMQINPSGESLGMWPRNGSAGLYGNFIFLGTNSNRESRIQVVNGGSVQAEIVGSVLTAGWHKFAFAYKANDFAFYVDGVLVGTDSSGSVPSGMDELYIDQYIDGGIRNAAKKQALLFKTRLTNAQLAELTAL